MNTEALLVKAKKATQYMTSLTDAKARAALVHLSKRILERSEYILAENAKDLARMETSNPKYDRLQLTEARLKNIADDLINVAQLPNPVGKILDSKKLENGLLIEKISVPLGVIGIIYEARPNVTLDCFALAIKSGNVTVLKGGTDATNSNTAIIDVIYEVLKSLDINEDIVQLLPSDRHSTEILLKANSYIDILIPRGSQQLIDYVRSNATVPVIETGAGIVHVYLDEKLDKNIAQLIVNNAKTRRVSVCNALDCVIVHKDTLQHLGEICAPLAKSNVLIYADKRSYASLQHTYPSELLQPATESSFGTEFLDYKLAIKTVDSIQEALEHISHYSSKHSESIVSTIEEHCTLFSKAVDAAAVYINVSTAFTDGAQFGMGAEIGISTQKLHARGPMALPELTTYKYVIKGNGQIRS